MKYYDAFAENGYHSAFLTTFTFGTQSFEDMVLQRLRNAGCNNIHVLADQTMLNQELSLFGPPKYAGSLYHLLKCRRLGAFHSKIVLQLGRKKARLLIGSANLTGPGLAGNLELVSQISCSGSDDPSASLIAEAMNYISQSVVDADPWFKRGVEQALARSPWLDVAVAASSFDHSDFGLTALVHDAQEQTPLEQFISLIDGDPIKRLSIISPYWDAELRALNDLAERLGHPQIRVALETERGLFPGKAAKNIPKITIHELGKFSGSRRIHAKLIIAEGKFFDHVLSGSFNCSRPALLTSSSNPLNAEAGIYRRATKKTVVKFMGLKPCFKTSVSLNELPEYEQFTEAQESPLQFREGGTLFLSGNKLTWLPPANISEKVVQVELVAEGSGLTTKMVALSFGKPFWSGSVPLECQISTYGVIVFDDGERSAPITICNMLTLSRKSQPVAGQKVQNQLAALESLDSEDLEIIDILYKLEQLEASERQSHLPASPKSRHHTPEKSTDEHQILTYEAFIAGRIENRSNSTSAGDDVFADRYVSDVSRVLNRILGIVAPELSESPNNDDEDLRPTEHTSEDDIESDSFARTPIKITSQQTSEACKSNTHTIEAIVSAVNRFTETLSHNATREISLTQLIHLRALLQVILAFAIPYANSASPQQVLPHFDTAKKADWPRLVGKTLVAFYRYGSNPIADFRLPVGTDTIPYEIIDCWACVEVAANLSAICANSFTETQFIARHLEKLSKQTSACLDQSIMKFPDAKLRYEVIRSQLNSRFSSLAPALTETR